MSLDHLAPACSTFLAVSEVECFSSLEIYKYKTGTTKRVKNVPIIIPETNTVGAKSVKAAEFIAVVFQDIYSEKEQQDFIAALNLVNDKAKELEGSDFAKLSADKRAVVFNKVKDPKNTGLLSMYQMVLFAYLTSEKGMQASFRYVPVPGVQKGEIPYKKGDKMFVGLNG